MSFFFSSVTENTAIAVKKELMECDFDKSFFFLKRLLVNDAARIQVFKYMI